MKRLFVISPEQLARLKSGLESSSSKQSNAQKIETQLDKVVNQNTDNAAKWNHFKILFQKFINSLSEQRRPVHFELINSDKNVSDHQAGEYESGSEYNSVGTQTDEVDFKKRKVKKSARERVQLPEYIKDIATNISTKQKPIGIVTPQPSPSSSRTQYLKKRHQVKRPGTFRRKRGDLPYGISEDNILKSPNTSNDFSESKTRHSKRIGWATLKTRKI